MDILKQLPYDIQKIIYNDYLEKQRDYHIENYNNLCKGVIRLTAPRRYLKIDENGKSCVANRHSNPVLPYIEELKSKIDYIHKCWEFKQSPNYFTEIYTFKFAHPHYGVFRDTDDYEHFYFYDFCEKYVQERTGEDKEFLHYETTRNMVTEFCGEEYRFLWKTPNKNYKYKNTQHFTKFRELGYLFVDSDDED